MNFNEPNSLGEELSEAIRWVRQGASRAQVVEGLLHVFAHLRPDQAEAYYASAVEGVNFGRTVPYLGGRDPVPWGEIPIDPDVPAGYAQVDLEFRLINPLTKERERHFIRDYFTPGWTPDDALRSMLALASHLAEKYEWTRVPYILDIEYIAIYRSSEV